MSLNVCCLSKISFVVKVISIGNTTETLSIGNIIQTPTLVRSFAIYVINFDIIVCFVEIFC